MIPTVRIACVLEVKTLMAVVVVEKGDEESAGFAVGGDHRALVVLASLIHGSKTGGWSGCAGMFDDGAERPLEREVEGGVDADGVGITGPGVPADKVAQVAFGNGDFAVGEEIFLADRKREFAHGGAEGVAENDVGDFEGIDAEAIAIEPGNNVLIGANQRVLNGGILAHELLE